MKISTWNVNGIRARGAEVRAWIEEERPDAVCLQEIKARPDQLPPLLFEPEGYWCAWHGAGGYSGVALHLSRDLAGDKPACAHPEFDYETRIVTAEVGRLTLASIYAPNGNKDYAAKVRFLEALVRWARDLQAGGRLLLLCGDMNVAHTERDVHPKERKATAIGQLPEERALFDELLSTGLTDVGRALDPDNDNLFTWWAPWRNLRQRNIGWRLDYVLASEPLARTARACTVRREYGTSDHGPVTAVFDWSPGPTNAGSP